VIAYLLVNGENKALVIINFSSIARLKINTQHVELPGIYKNAFSGIEHTLEHDAAFELQPWEFIVWTT